jgi:vacuolar protein sorting-associated protein 8
MDLQSILDGSDSSDEVYSEQNSSYRYADTSASSATGIIDIERILRESEDEDDDESMGGDYNRRRDHRVITADDIIAGLALESYSKGDTSGGVDGTLHKSNGDWDVLQSILTSDDEEEDEVDDDWLNTRIRAQSFASSEQLLDESMSLGFPELDNERLGESAVLPPAVTKGPIPSQGANASMMHPDLVIRNASSFCKGSPLRTSFYDPAHMKDVDVRKQRIVDQLTSDMKDNETSRRALAYAHDYEQKLLMSGHRDMVSPLRVKRRLKQKIELTARGQEHSNPNAGRISWLPVARFGSSGIVDNKRMERISTSMEKHSLMGAKVQCGLPTALAFNSRFIAVGTQLGIILLYDLFEVLRQRLGATYDDNSQSAHRAGSVTAIDLSLSGETIVAGYTSGLVVLWDTIRGIVLRAVTEAHLSPIASIRILSDLKVVTVDAGGLVNKLTFAKNILWANYSLETECLLDGTAGQILALDVLAPYSTLKKLERTDSFATYLRKMTLIAISSERSSFTVAVEPQINVLHRWARPPSSRIDVVSRFEDLPSHESFLPCLAWGWALVAGGGNKLMPILARGWGCCLQLLCASFPTLELTDVQVDTNPDQPQMHWPAFGVHKEIDSEKPIVALEWLDDRSLMYLTITNEFTLVDTVMMTLLERLDVSGLRLVYAEFALSRSATQFDIGNTENGVAPSTAFQNTIRYNDNRLMILCKSELQCISLVGARRRISSLEEDGEWLEALALALDHYEYTVVSQEDRKRDQTGRKDLSRHPDFMRVRHDDEEWLSKLLIRYLKLAVENAPEPMSAKPYSRSSANNGNELARSHFQMLAGVCIEFCVVTRKAELLFGPIFEQFQSVGYTSIFLDVLEPYVLNDKLPYIGAEAMSFFVQHCKATNDIATVERCLLHMDCSIMDFDTILSLLRRNAMYTALFYVYNSGLDDYVTPLEMVLEEVFFRADAGNASLRRRADGIPQTDFERLGYKALLYLRACFLGKTFPRENDMNPEERRRLVRQELLSFLFQKEYSSSSQRNGSLASSSAYRSLSYPYLRILLLVDARGVFETISLWLDSPESNLNGSLGSEMDGGDVGGNINPLQTPSLQQILQIASAIIRPTTPSKEVSTLTSRSTLNSFLYFAAKYMMNGAVTLDRDTTYMVLERSSHFFTAADNAEGRKQAQNRVMNILSALPRESYDPDKVLDVIKRNGMHRAALLLHQQVASSWNVTGSDAIELRSKHFQSAIDCYIGDEDPQFRTEVYAYVKKECSGVANMEDTDGSHPTTLRRALFLKLAALCRLDALMTASLVADLFVDNLDDVVDALDSSDEDQFRFLHAIASGSLGQVDPVAGSVLILHTEHYQTYLALMAKLHPEMVYDYLSTHDNYRTQECLVLCEEYDIPDATVYLLERTDMVNEALRQGLQTLESRMMELKRTIRGMEIDSLQQKYVLDRSSSNNESSNLQSKQERALHNLKRMLTVVLDVCERKSSAHGSKLWFTVLDRLISAKGLLRLSKEQREHATKMSGVLSDLLRLTMQRMVSSVPLKDLVQKVTTDSSGSNLGELREMVDSLLGTYNFELKVFQGATTVFHQDAYGMRTHHYHLCVQGSLVQSIANQPLTPETFRDVAVLSRHSTQQGSTLQVVGNAGTAFFLRDTLPYTQRAESGLANALSRVRSRRVDRDSRYRDSGRSTTGSLNMTTGAELAFRSTTEPIVIGQRPVGALGSAQHHGRLIMFE